MGRRSFKVLGVVLALFMVLTSGCGSAADEKKSESAVPAADRLKFSADQTGSKELAQSTASQAEGGAPANGGAAKTDAKAAAAADASAQASAGFTAAAAAQSEGLNRKLIYKANLTMKVEDYAKAQADIRDLVTLAGGYILQFAENSTNREEGGQFTLKIPSAGFASFMKDLEQIPHLSLQRSAQAQDVSEEYVDLEARLKAKQILEARYLEFMQKAAKTDDLVTYTNELGKIQEEIERIKGRMRFIDTNVAFSTVEIRVYQPEGKADAQPDEARQKKNVLVRARDAMGASFGVLSLFGQGLVVAAAAALPVIAVAVIVGVPVWVLYRIGKRKSGKNASSDTGRQENGEEA